MYIIKYFFKTLTYNLFNIVIFVSATLCFCKTTVTQMRRVFRWKKRVYHVLLN